MVTIIIELSVVYTLKFTFVLSIHSWVESISFQFYTYRDRYWNIFTFVYLLPSFYHKLSSILFFSRTSHIENIRIFSIWSAAMENVIDANMQYNFLTCQRFKMKNTFHNFLIVGLLSWEKDFYKLQSSFCCGRIFAALHQSSECIYFEISCNINSFCNQISHIQ